jgi:hypothetical protein
MTIGSPLTLTGLVPTELWGLDSPKLFFAKSAAIEVSTEPWMNFLLSIIV